MATKSELIERNQKLARQLAERDQDRRDKVDLSKRLSDALLEIERLKAICANTAKPVERVVASPVERVVIRRHADDQAEIAMLRSENHKLKREMSAK